ncbi:CDK5 regulatory subunit-associated protein 1, partial [Syncephalis pseudoplumigaleata]
AQRVQEAGPQRRRESPLVFDNRGPSQHDFIRESQLNTLPPSATTQPDTVPYLEPPSHVIGAGAKYYIEVYGCQMNFNDTEVLMAVMNEAGYTRTKLLDEANIVFLVTCSIRENAEKKIWQRLRELKHLKTGKNRDRPPLIGVLGCMAERLKGELLEKEKLVDVVCGPDAYRRTVPHLLSMTQEMNRGIANVMLSADETYADIMPVRLDQNSTSAYISIMRGCNNMCAFCVVPFTRGTERSRSIDSILAEVQALSEQGVKEVTLLGQNVNSYRDTSTLALSMSTNSGSTLSNDGFRTIYRRKEGGLRFTELLDKVSRVNPNMRFRFTSPHPKDFPVDLLQLIADRPNICANLHLPAQSGSTTTLARMRRGYSREAQVSTRAHYLALVDTVRATIPNVTLSSDFITGFCDETEEEHRDTVSLMAQVGFDMAYMFAYSMREKTHAHRRMKDNVPEDVKLRRLSEIIGTFHEAAHKNNRARVGQQRELVLVDGTSRRDAHRLRGRTDGNHKVIFDQVAIPDRLSSEPGAHVIPQPGDYVEVITTDATSTSFQGIPLARTDLVTFHKEAAASLLMEQ